VKGVYCVIRYVDTWMDNNFDERGVFQVGSKKTLTVWAEEGFCSKTALSSDLYMSSDDELSHSQFLY
jgi:hypothetical protein